MRIIYWLPTLLTKDDTYLIMDDTYLIKDDTFLFVDIKNIFKPPFIYAFISNIHDLNDSYKLLLLFFIYVLTPPLFQFGTFHLGERNNRTQFLYSGSTMKITR